MRIYKLAISGCAVALLSGTALAGQDGVTPASLGERYDISVTFSNRLEKRLSSIDRVERIREERFRKSFVDERSSRSTILGRESSRFHDVNWAGEYLIPDLDEFGVEMLVRRMIAHNLSQAQPNFDGSIELSINRLKVDDHSVAYLRGANSYIKGRLTVRTADGSKIFDEKVSANLVVDPTVDQDYQGPDFAFAQTDETDRVGPTLSYFVERSMEQVWPDKKDEIAGPVIVRFTGPNVSIID